MADTTPLSVHQPSGEPKGGIIVIQEAFGVNDHIEDVARRFAAEGWLAVAPHLFHRSGDPKFGYEDLSKVMPVMQALQADEIVADVHDALVAVAAEGVALANTGIVGFCMGGTVALHAATRLDLGAS